jgi:hypothetical protein
VVSPLINQSINQSTTFDLEIGSWRPEVLTLGFVAGLDLHLIFTSLQHSRLPVCQPDPDPPISTFTASVCNQFLYSYKFELENMSFTYGQPQRWQSPPEQASRAPPAASFTNTMPASASSTRDDKKKKKDKNSKDKPIKVVGTKPAEELEEEIKANDMSPTIKYVELHRHGSKSWICNWTVC